METGTVSSMVESEHKNCTSSRFYSTSAVPLAQSTSLHSLQHMQLLKQFA